MHAYVYGLHLADDRLIRYVGLTTETLAMRLQGHREDARSQSKRHLGRPVLKWMRHHGLDAARICELEVTAVELVREREVYWIERLQTYAGDRLGGLNGTRGGDGTWGYQHTAEARERIRAAAASRTYPERIARTLAATQQAREDRCRAKGHERVEVATPGAGPRCAVCLREQGAAIAGWNAGQPWSAEARARMSASSMGQVAWNRGRTATPEEVERNRLAQHTYWHVQRNVTKRGCALCEATAPESAA